MSRDVSLFITHIKQIKWQELTTLAFLFCLFVSIFSSQSAQAMQIQGVQIQGDRDNAQVYSGVVYGPIDQNDTLWRIASRYKQDSQFSVYQTMLAIFQLNPQAFENGNFNTMVNGATLQLPSDRYIARIDPREARAKAERDDQAFGRPNSVRENVNSAPENNSNLKPDVPLVNQEDLSKTQAQLQGQLNNLRRQQQQQFEDLKNQVTASINTVEVLLEENKKLNQQLLLIDENNRKLTEAVETELQNQIDQQVEQLSELIALVKEAEQRRLEQESKSIMQILSSPMAIIIMMSTVTLLVIVGLALVLMRRPVPAPVTPSEVNTKAADIVDEDLVIGEVDDDINKDSDDLLAALSNDADLEEDDILSDELEEDDALANLDEEILGGELDDMLVPDSQKKTDNIEEDFDIDEFDLESEDDISLDEEAGISLDDEVDISLDDELNLDSSELIEEQDATNVEDQKPEVESNPETSNVPSTDIDEIEEEDNTPPGIDLDVNGEIDENTLEQIGSQIEEKDQTISQMADDILNDLNNVPSDSASVDELIPQQEDEAEQVIDEDLPDLVDESESTQDEINENQLENDTPESESEDELVNTDVDDLANDINSLSDELLDELSESNKEADELDALLDASLDEDFDVQDDNAKEIDEEKAIDTRENDIDDLDKEVLDLSLDAENNAEQELEDDQISALADELLQELQSDDSQSDDTQSDELDALLADLEQEDASEQSIDLAGSVDDTTVDDGSPLSSSVDSDGVLDDIPSFTSDSSQNSESELDEEQSKDEPNNADNQEDLTQSASEEQSSQKSEHFEEDVLASLPDLDSWLDEEDSETNRKIAEDIAQITEKDDGLDLSALDLDLDDIDVLGDNDSVSDESALMQELDDANFDDMLLDLDSDDKDIEAEKETGADKVSSQDTPIDVLQEAGLDLDALMDESSADKQFDEDDFVDVDDLLKESNSLPQMSDDEKLLDLSDSLTSDADADIEFGQMAQDDQQQASNLDLAQVYIEMDDEEAAQELLEEVTQKGNEEQRSEALSLLKNIKK